MGQIFNFRWVLFVLSIGVLLGGMFVLGAYYSCDVAGEGTLIGLECVDMRVVEVVEDDGRFYTADNFSGVLDGIGVS